MSTSPEDKIRELFEALREEYTKEISEAAIMIKACQKWTTEHEDEVNEFAGKKTKSVQMAIASNLVNEHPSFLPFVATREFVRLMEVVISIGYFYGRTYIPIPEVFKEKPKKRFSAKNPFRKMIKKGGENDRPKQSAKLGN